jgi:hypothetical protein
MLAIGQKRPLGRGGIEPGDGAPVGGGTDMKSGRAPLPARPALRYLLLPFNVAFPWHSHVVSPRPEPAPVSNENVTP